LTDTNIEDFWSGEDFAIGTTYQVTARSLLLFAVNSAEATNIPSTIVANPA
jgi:hypothetical protein